MSKNVKCHKRTRAKESTQAPGNNVIHIWKSYEGIKVDFPRSRINYKNKCKGIFRGYVFGRVCRDGERNKDNNKRQTAANKTRFAPKFPAVKPNQNAVTDNRNGAKNVY